MSAAQLGAIEIQMLMDTARWSADWRNTNRIMDQGLASMKSSIAGVLGGLTAGLGVAAFVGMIKGSIAAAEALHDLKMQTGASVESLSAMVAVGRTTGTTAETIGAAMNKLGKNLAVANEDSKGVGQALKALGINLADLRRMKPDEQMLTLAAAMNKFEDGSGKSAVAMTLLGKEGAKLLPYMKDLADTGVLVATVTTEQAAAADEYNDSITRSHMRTEAWKRSLGMELMPVMASVHDMTGLLGQAIGEYLTGGVQDATKGFDYMGLVIGTVGTIMEALVLLGSDVAFVLKGMGREIGGLVAQFSALGEGGGIFSAEGRAAWASVGQAMTEDADTARAALDAFQAKIAGTTDRILQSREALRNHSVGAAENNRELAGLGARYGVMRKAVLDFKAAGEDAAKSERDSTKSLLDSYAKMADATALKIIEAQHEIDAGNKLTDAEKDYVKVMLSVRDGKVTLTKLEREGTLAKLKANMASDAGLELSKEEVRWMSESLKANVAAQDAMAKTTEGLRDQVAKQREANEVIGLNAEQLAAREAATLRDTAAALDNKAAWAEDVDWTGKMSADLRAQAQARRDLADQIGKGVVLKEAQAAADEWKKTTDSIGQGLTDSLFRAFEAGAGFFDALWDGIKNTFKTTALKMVITPVQQYATQAVNSGAGYLGSAAQSGLGTLTGSAGSMWGGAGWGATAAAAGNYGAVYSGAAYGTGFGTQQSAMLASQEAGMTSSAGSASMGAAAGWAALIVAGVLKSKSDYEKGWKRDGLDQSWNKNINWAINPVYSSLIKPLEKLGVLNSKWADILGGDTAMARTFGRRPAEATAQGITGQFGAGAFVGQQFMDWKAKGGFFRSDKTGTNTAGLDDLLGSNLNSSAAELLAQTKAYAEALALPVSGLVNVTSSARVVLGTDAAKNAEAIAAALATYGGALVKDYEAALAGVSEPSETAVDTLGRLGESIRTVNTIFETLGLHLVRTSLAGGTFAAELVAMSGGLDAFLAKTQNYLAAYFTQAEQLGLGAGGVLHTLKDAGIDFSGATSRGDLRSRLEGLDPNTASGREQMSALLTVAGDFAKLTDYLAANSLTLGDLASQAPVVGLLVDDPATRSATAGEQSAALLQTSNDRLADIAGSSANSAAQLQALLALQAAANQALLAQLQSLQQATEDAARLADLAPVYVENAGT